MIRRVDGRRGQSIVVGSARKHKWRRVARLPNLGFKFPVGHGVPIGPRRALLFKPIKWLCPYMHHHIMMLGLLCYLARVSESLQPATSPIKRSPPLLFTTFPHIVVIPFVFLKKRFSYSWYVVSLKWLPIILLARGNPTFCRPFSEKLWPSQIKWLQSIEQLSLWLSQEFLRCGAWENVIKRIQQEEAR